MKPAPEPLVTSVASRIKQTIPDNGVDATTPEETKKRKKKFLALLDKAADKFADNLEKGKVELTNTTDIDRIVKLTLLVSGEADSIQGTTGNTTIESDSLDIKDIDKILTMNDPEAEAVFNKLFESYNERNEKENSKLNETEVQ